MDASKRMEYLALIKPVIRGHAMYAGYSTAKQGENMNVHASHEYKFFYFYGGE